MLSITLLVIPLMIYAIFPKLRDFHGKLIMILLSSQVLILIIMPFLEVSYEIHYDLGPVLGIIIYAIINSTVVIIIAMLCDVWLTFK